MLKIVPVKDLAHAEPEEGGLYALRGEGAAMNAFHAFFKNLLDPNSDYIYNALLANQDRFADPYFSGRSLTLEKAEDLIRKEGQRLLEQLRQAALMGQAGQYMQRLNSLFVSLNRNQRNTPAQASPLVEARERRNPKEPASQFPFLRVFAVCFGLNYVVTEGFIKMAATTQGTAGGQGAIDRLQALDRQLTRNGITQAHFTLDEIELN